MQAATTTTTRDGLSGNGTLLLPARGNIWRVDQSDPLPYYYLPLVGWLYRYRLEMALGLLGHGPYEAILEAGYGSGILLSSLAARGRRISGIDLHRRTDLVEHMLREEGIHASLAVGDVRHLSYADASFDAVVCISTLEHLDHEQLEAAVAEMKRVLRPDGVAVLGVPASGRTMDLLFRLIGFSEIGEHHVSTLDDIEQALRRHFRIEGERRMPGLGPKRASLYTVYRCRA